MESFSEYHHEVNDRPLGMISGLGKVFVSGATGFVGQRLITHLLEQADLSSIRVLSRSRHSVLETVECDLLTQQIPESALDGIDTVFHLAGYAHDLGDADKEKDRYRKVNVDSTSQLAELAQQSGTKRFIFVSSVKAGGGVRSGHCANEEEQSPPEGVYGRTKREAELELLGVGEHSGMHVSIVRPALVYGAGVKGNLRRMLSAIEKGWFPPLPETHNRRSMIHVDDLVRALLLVAKDKRSDREIYIATDGMHYSSRQIYDLMRSGLGKMETRLKIPDIFFRSTAWFGDRLGEAFPMNSYRYQKLLGDECYSSEKLSGLGFKPLYTLEQAIPAMVAQLDSKAEGEV